MCTGAGAGSGSTRFRKGSGSGSTGFRRRFRLGGFGAEAGQVQQGSGEGLGGFGVEPGQVQQRSREGSGEGLGGFGAKPGQVQKGSQEGSGEGSGRLWCRARSGSTGSGQIVGGFGSEPGQVQQGSGEKAWEALVQSQVKFNRVPEKVPEKVLEIFGAKPSQIQGVPETPTPSVLGGLVAGHSIPLVLEASASLSWHQEKWDLATKTGDANKQTIRQSTTIMCTFHVLFVGFPTHHI